MSEGEFDPDPDRVAALREIADDIRETGSGSEPEQLAAILYRVSDLYDEEGDTTPPEIYRNVKNILEIKERGTLERN